jgi:hypothetical protein
MQPCRLTYLPTIVGKSSILPVIFQTRKYQPMTIPIYLSVMTRMGFGAEILIARPARLAVHSETRSHLVFYDHGTQDSVWNLSFSFSFSFPLRSSKFFPSFSVHESSTIVRRLNILPVYTVEANREHGIIVKRDNFHVLRNYVIDMSAMSLYKSNLGSIQAKPWKLGSTQAQTKLKQRNLCFNLHMVRYPCSTEYLP